MSEHAILAPSGAATRKQCAGSRWLQEQYPEREDSPHAIEGRLAHECVVACYNESVYPDGATEEMMDGAEMMAHEIRKWSGVNSVHLEEKVDCSLIHDECDGTPDCYWLDKEGKRVYLLDYKFGHRFVGVYENWQLIEYALGIIDTYPQVDESWEVVMMIIQPRCFVDEPIREWTVPVSELLDTYLPICVAFEKAAMMNELADCHTGPTCIDCSARHVCKVYQKVNYTCVQLADKPVAQELDDVAIGREKQLLDEAIQLLKGRIDGLEQEMLHRIKSGKVLPGWRAKQGTGRQKWDKSIEEVIALGQLMGIDIGKPGALTPQQAIKAGLPEELVDSYSSRPPGEIKLVRDDGKQANKVFGN